jgi:antagonist of KipI
MLEVIEAGLSSTIQDLGRVGAAALGVRRAGAADPVALQAANLLAGAAVDAPALEMTLLGGTFAVRADCLVGLAGADMEARVPEDDRDLRPGASYRLRAGTTLTFGGAIDGARTYLALDGGIAAQYVLRSASTDPTAGFGGMYGRPLQAGDILATPVTRPGRERTWPADLPSSGIRPPGREPRLAALHGPHLPALPLGTAGALTDQAWSVTARSDRAGLRLDGAALAGADTLDLVSQPMIQGAVQLLPSGLPIVLMPDAPTVGGYPVVAVVAEVDRAATGQARPGDQLRFAWVELAEARARALASARRLAAVAAALA